MSKPPVTSKPPVVKPKSRLPSGKIGSLLLEWGRKWSQHFVGYEGCTVHMSVVYMSESEGTQGWLEDYLPGYRMPAKCFDRMVALGWLKPLSDHSREVVVRHYQLQLLLDAAAAAGEMQKRVDMLSLDTPPDVLINVLECRSPYTGRWLLTQRYQCAVQATTLYKFTGQKDLEEMRKRQKEESL